MRIAFLDFWYDFEPKNNFFVHALQRVTDNVQVVDPKDADILFFSVFGNENSAYKNCKRIIYTGENISSHRLLSVADKSLSFEETSEHNARLPLWFLYIDWFGVGSYGNPNYLIPVEDLTFPNRWTGDRSKFMVSVYSNPVFNRQKAVQTISEKIDKVECFGKCHENKLAGAEKEKLDLLSSYKYNLCFENSKTNGYITEKLLHARASGCAPVYWGASDVLDDFNDAMIVFDEDWDKLIKDISAFDMEKLSMPILKDTSLNNAYRALKHVI